MPMVSSGLAHTLALARAADFPRQHIVLDPGFGFGKQGDENFTLLAHFAELHQFQLPFLVGLSRKRFLTAHITNATEEVRTQATTAANTAAILAGAHLLRAHDIPAARAAASVADAIYSSAEPGVPGEHPSGIRQVF
jgi:dihydropteroate synthase